MRMA
jgi:pimeloyl-ACP methyl ester carboxylesterase